PEESKETAQGFRGTRLCLQSLVCYTFAKERAAGWDGFGLSSWRTRCLCGEYQRQRNAGRWCGLHSSASLSPSVEQRYITILFSLDISLRLALCYNYQSILLHLVEIVLPS